jgi:signal transduction histidine kinase
MTTREHMHEPLARPSMMGAMAVVVIAAFGWNVIEGYDPRPVIVPIGLVYLVLSTLGWRWAERRGQRAIDGWLAALLAITLVTLQISHLGLFLIAMPLIWFAALYSSLRAGIGMTVLFLVYALGVNLSRDLTPWQIYSYTTGFLPGAVFINVLAQFILRERDARQQVRRYAAQVEELATTRERNRIARDIHDSVGHYLTVVHVQIEAARATLDNNVTASFECLTRAQDFAREGLAELRRSVSMLRTGAVDQRPFGVALAQLVEDTRNGGLDTALTVHGAPRLLTPAVEFTLFRAAQEALTNVARHANATRATCTLRYTEREVTLEIADDGVGAVSPDGGFGLVGLRERALLVDGSVEIRTSPGRGFAVEVRVPT